MENKFGSIIEIARFIAISSSHSYLKKIVFTTGVFDVPHIGHPRYLSAAKKFGDFLVVGVHSDSLVKKRKGKNRPIFPAHDRMEFLSYYSSVDFVLELKNQEEVYNAIRFLNPYTLVVSETTEDVENNSQTMRTLFGDYTRIEVLGAQSSVHSTDFVKAMEKVETLK